MKRLPLILTVAGLGVVLTACGQKPAAPMAETETAAPAAGDAMAGMDMKKADAAAPAMAKGAGTVTAIDKTAGTITLDHGPIPELDWPAMTMAFPATPASLLDTVKVGDKVSFDLKMADGSGEITAIQVQ